MKMCREIGKYILNILLANFQYFSLFYSIYAWANSWRSIEDANVFNAR